MWETITFPLVYTLGNENFAFPYVSAIIALAEAGVFLITYLLVTAAFPALMFYEPSHWLPAQAPATAAYLISLARTFAALAAAFLSAGDKGALPAG